MADDPTQSNPAALDLDDHVDQLLEQMDSECARLESNSPAPIGTPEPLPTPPEPATTEPNQTATEPGTADTEPGTPTELDANLDAKVGEMIAEAERAEAEEDPSDAPPPLDAGENDAQNGIVSADPAAAADESAAEGCLADLTSQLLAGDLDFDDDGSFDSTPASNDATGTNTGAVPASGPATSPSSAADAAPAAPVAPKAPSPVVVLASKVGITTKRAAAFALPIGATGVMKIDAPLESRDPAVRQTVGWMALYTAFLGLCVWGYVLLIRTPEPPATQTAGAAMVGEVSAAQGSESSGSIDSGADSASAESVARQD